MKNIELHVIQSYANTCLNRDDLGSPKSCIFGGVERARISSQCLKRAVREMTNGETKTSFRGTHISLLVAEKLVTMGVDYKIAKEIAIGAISSATEKPGTDKEVKKPGSKKVKSKGAEPNEDGGNDSEDDSNSDQDNPELSSKSEALLFFLDAELIAISEKLKELLDTCIGDGVSKEKLIESVNSKMKMNDWTKLIKSVEPKNGADILIYGRMVADNSDLTVEGACVFSHAFSTHECESEIDYFTAVNEAHNTEEQAHGGAAHIGTSEFNSACYYRYIGINTDMLDEQIRKGMMSVEDKKEILCKFLTSAVVSSPKARKNSMFGMNPPAYVLGVKRDGQPMTLANAFETPIVSDHEGYIQKSIAQLKSFWNKTKQTYCINPDVEVELGIVDINTFIKSLIG